MVCTANFALTVDLLQSLQHNDDLSTALDCYSTSGLKKDSSCELQSSWSQSFQTGFLVQDVVKETRFKQLSFESKTAPSLKILFSFE